MITLKTFLEIIEYKISDTDKFCWNCYGPNARFMDYWNGLYDNGVSIGIVFDTATQVVYQMEAWDYDKSREYRWIHPDYRDAIESEAKRRGVDNSESIDGNKFICLDLTEDMLEKATAIFNGKDYDTRIQVQLELSADEVSSLMRQAHEHDVSLNQFVEKILMSYIELHDPQPTWP